MSDDLVGEWCRNEFFDTFLAASSATLAFSPAWGIYGLLKRYWDERG